jgi:hypothetical protein
MAERRITRIAGEVVDRAFLYDDPESFRAGVAELMRALSDGVDIELVRPGVSDLTWCAECHIPFDDQDPDRAECPWCGARNLGLLQGVSWAEFEALDAAWPEALRA